jgi:thiamine biosynthesis lipoprotein
MAMTVLHAERAPAEAALDAAFAEIELVEEVMSLYRPESQLCRLNRDGLLDHPHPYLVSVLSGAQRLAERSGGAFDVTVQPLWSLYAAARKAGMSPDPEELAKAKAKVDWRRLEVSARRIRLAPGMAVTLNGIAQGFASDRALAALKRHGIQHALVDAGEVGSLGEKADGEPWIVGIQHPRLEDAYVEVTPLAGRCLATSGDYATSFSADRSDHHIFDPKTGRSPREFASVSVLAESGLLADGLSTTLFVLGLARGMELVSSVAGADALFVLKDGRTLATPGFPQHA